MNALKFSGIEERKERKVSLVSDNKPYEGDVIEVGDNYMVLDMDKEKNVRIDFSRVTTISTFVNGKWLLIF